MNHEEAAVRPRPRLRFARHALEMLIAMVIGMLALGPLGSFVWPGLDGNPTANVLVMATNMSIGMAAWMRFRGHAWRPIAEMCASMYLPFAVLLVPFWAGAIGAGALMTWGHVLMLPTMALVMLLRPDEYAH